MSQSAVSRIWRAFGLRPHRTQTLKLSSDPAFIEKVRDVVGLYLAPPDRDRQHQDDVTTTRKVLLYIMSF